MRNTRFAVRRFFLLLLAGVSMGMAYSCSNVPPETKRNSAPPARSSKAEETPRPPEPSLSRQASAVARFDFEASDPAWTGVFDDPRVDRAEAVHGKACLEVRADRPVNREYLSPFFSVESGHSYRISAWIRVDRFEKGYSPLAINIRWYFAPEESCSWGGWNICRVMRDDLKTPPGWTRVERTVMVPAWPEMKGKISHARLQVRNYRTIGVAYVDDLSVEAVSEKRPPGNAMGRETPQADDESPQKF